MKKHIETQNLFKKFESSVQSRDTHLLNVIGHWSYCFQFFYIFRVYISNSVIFFCWN